MKSLKKEASSLEELNERVELANEIIGKLNESY